LRDSRHIVAFDRFRGGSASVVEREVVITMV
jgi:hypothetical protein